MPSFQSACQESREPLANQVDPSIHVTALHGLSGCEQLLAIQKEVKLIRAGCEMDAKLGMISKTEAETARVFGGGIDSFR